MEQEYKDRESSSGATEKAVRCVRLGSPYLLIGRVDASSIRRPRRNRQRDTAKDTCLRECWPRRSHG